MDRASICIPRILKHEGGFVNHPSDPGGATNKGITLATFRRYIKRNGTVADLKALTEAQAVEVYRRQYWDKVRASELPVGLDYAVADFAVNSGPSRAAKYLQGVLGVARDGVVGPKTIAAARAMGAGTAITALCDRRMAFLRGLKTWKVFGKGWTRRVNDVREDSLADAKAVFTARQAPAQRPAVTPTPTPAKPTPAAPAPLGAAGKATLALLAAISAGVAYFWESVKDALAPVFNLFGG